MIGVITNRDIVIKLKNGKTLDSLGLASKKIDFTTVWVRSDGMADKGGYDNGFILKNNPNVPALPTNSSSGNENYLGTGMNGLEHDGTKSKDGNFSGGHTGKIVSFVISLYSSYRSFSASASNAAVGSSKMSKEGFL